MGNWEIAMQAIRSLNELLFSNFSEEDAFEKAIVQGFDQALLDFENLVKEGLPVMSLKSFRHLFQQHWNTKSIAYHGNPLEGLQIMGLLETRLLDFKNHCFGIKRRENASNKSNSDNDSNGFKRVF